MCTGDALNVNANRTKVSLRKTEKCSNHEFLPPQLKNYLVGKITRKNCRVVDMEGHAKKCVERYCELTNKKTEQLYKVSSPCFDDHHFKKEELESVGELSGVWSQIVFEMLVLGTNW